MHGEERVRYACSCICCSFVLLLGSVTSSACFSVSPLVLFTCEVHVCLVFILFLSKLDVSWPTITAATSTRTSPHTKPAVEEEQPRTNIRKASNQPAHLNDGLRLLPPPLHTRSPLRVPQPLPRHPRHLLLHLTSPGHVAMAFLRARRPETISGSWAVYRAVDGERGLLCRRRCWVWWVWRLRVEG